MHNQLIFNGKRRLAVGTVWLAIIAAICFLISVADGAQNAMVFAIGLTFAAIGYNLLQTPPVSVEFNADSFRADHGTEIPYSEINSLTANGTPYTDSSKITFNQVEIGYGDKTLVLPKKGNVSAADVFRFLLPKLQTGPSRPDLLPSILKEFYTHQVNMFGETKVWAFGGLAHKSRQQYRSLKPKQLGIAGLFFAVATLLAYLVLGKESVAVVSVIITIAIFGGLCLMISKISEGSVNAKYYKHPLGIVIGPQGIAVAQGGVNGQQSWESIGSVTVSNRGYPRGISLGFPGANLIIADLYHCPLQNIQEIISLYKGPS